MVLTFATANTFLQLNLVFIADIYRTGFRSRHFENTSSTSEAGNGAVLEKMMLLKILQISQANTCVEVSF